MDFTTVDMCIKFFVKSSLLQSDNHIILFAIRAWRQIAIYLECCLNDYKTASFIQQCPHKTLRSPWITSLAVSSFWLVISVFTLFSSYFCQCLICNLDIWNAIALYFHSCSTEVSKVSKGIFQRTTFCTVNYNLCAWPGLHSCLNFTLLKHLSMFWLQEVY